MVGRCFGFKRPVPAGSWRAEMVWVAVRSRRRKWMRCSVDLRLRRYLDQKVASPTVKFSEGPKCNEIAHGYQAWWRTAGKGAPSPQSSPMRLPRGSVGNGMV